MTETDLPWYFRVAELLNVDDNVRVRTRARVAIEQMATTDGVLPLSVQDEEITHVRAFIVDEDNPTVPLASQELTNLGGSGGFDTWATSTRPLSIPRVIQRRLGVRFAVSFGASSSCSNGADVTCYAKTGDIGLIHVHGFDRPTADVTTGAPGLRRAELVSCPGSPSPSFTTTTCTVTVRAQVDWGDAVDGALADRVATGGDCQDIARVRAKLGNGTPIDLRCRASAPGEPSTFEGSFDVAVGSGGQGLRLWYGQYRGRKNNGDECGDGQPAPGGGGNNPDPCWGSFNDSPLYDDNVPPGTVERSGPGFAEAGAGVANRTYGGSDALTDEIASATATIAGGPRNGQPASAVASCDDPSDTGCSASFNVTVELPGPLRPGAAHDFSVTSPGRRDHVLDCDPGGGTQGLEDAFAGGCEPTFGTRSDRTCPFASAFGGGLRQPWTCALAYTSGRVARDGRDDEPCGASAAAAAGGAGTIDCSAHPDNWPDWQRDPEDPRVVPVLLMGRPVSRPGTPVMPVHDFAYFYVRGRGGDPCAQSAGGADPDVPAGVIRGTFIKYVRRNDGGATGSGAPCDIENMGGCLPVMTR